MNNNNKSQGKESDIITKKGFLISLPGKKKDNSETTSSINLAKPKNEAAKKDNSKPDNKENRNEKKHPEGRPGRNDRNKNRHGDKKDNNNHNENRQEVRQDNKNNKDNRRQDKNRKNDKAANGKQEKNQQNKQLQEKSAAPENNNERRDRNDRNRHGKKNRHGDRNNNQNNQNREQRQEKKDNYSAKHDNRHENKVKAAPLSALSNDIAKGIGDYNESKAYEAPAREMSLEEKYKNAKPLAEQIAEQEMRQKGIKIPYDNQAKSEDTEKQEIVGIRFREAGKIYYFDPAGMTVPFGAPVIVETARGSEYGFTAISNRMIPVSSLTAPLKKIERLATPMDTQKHEANKALEKDAEKVFIEKVEKLNLAMNLIYVEYTFDNSKLIFYFTAETRIDFRELVKELAGVFRTRIELRQIGVRDEAKMLGGMGVCGRATCCNTFLGDFAQVSIKMAKDQSLSLNAAKISGACGKLMCCLRYEDKVYEEENARTPKVGSVVETSEGKGVVVERNALKGIVSVQLELTPEAPAKPFPREEVMVVGFNKSKDDDDIDSEELKKLQDS